MSCISMMSTSEEYNGDQDNDIVKFQSTANNEPVSEGLSYAAILSQIKDLQDLQEDAAQAYYEELRHFQKSKATLHGEYP